MLLIRLLKWLVAPLAILGEKDKPWVLQTVSYIELTKILESPGSYVFMFGGPWCGNTQAVIKLSLIHI